MNVNNTIIQYKGFFDYGLLNKVLLDFTNYVQEKRISNYFYKKIQIAMVEMLENNYQYTQNIEEQIQKNPNILPEFKIQKTNGGYKITSSNPVQIEDAKKLKDHIDQINNSSVDQLKELYKEILKDGMFSTKKTSGTGLIRIAKVTKNKIRYSFHKIDNKLLYYTLEIMVNPK